MLQGDADKQYLLAGIAHGFDILENKCPDVSAECRNYCSASIENIKKVEAQICCELIQGNYIQTYCKPRVVSALGAIPKSSGSIRLIHDLSRPRMGVNQFVSESSCSYNTVDMATALMRPGCYLCKVDLKSAYRSVPIHPRKYAYTGLGWTFLGDSIPTYMYDTKLPFGSRKACMIFSAISN